MDLHSGGIFHIINEMWNVERLLQSEFLIVFNNIHLVTIGFGRHHE